MLYYDYFLDQRGGRAALAEGQMAQRCGGVARSARPRRQSRRRAEQPCEPRSIAAAAP